MEENDVLCDTQTELYVKYCLEKEMGFISDKF